ncbi:Negative elongation factor B [Toxocara canis]|uniref:Negative elongation factor B n=1 Tax=Toxocara canis TaxID=6265 RepID=A0A0B2VW00_TOXCA|nr:Negative elongation factor B [Toxocara canis]
MSSARSSSDRHWVVDLENHGIDGSYKLKHLLTTCADPIETIKEFQEKNGVKVIGDMTERLLTKLKLVGAIGTKESISKLEEQLEKSFKLYRVPRIRPIVLETLKQLPKVPDRYLKVIVADKEFYDSCAVSVRQQIWLKNDSLYLEAIHPVVDSYIAAKTKILVSVDQTPVNFFTCETTKARRQWPQIQDLISMVGERDSLYERLIDVVRERFIKTGDVNYCSLRMELIMAAHDANVDSIIKMDTCHDFAWCLDACVRDKHLDAQQTSKLKNILELVKKSPPEVVGDMAMVAADAHVVHFLSSMSVKVLKDTAVNCSGHLPRELPSLHLLLRLLTLGASAHHIVSTKDASAAQTVDALVFTKFLSAMTTLIVEDVLRNELARAPDEIVDDNPPTDYLTEPSDAVLSFLKTDVSCALLWTHYVLELLPSKRKASDSVGIIRFLKLLPKLKDKMAYRDPWAHLITHRVVQPTPFDNLLSNEEAANCFIDEYMINGLDIGAGIKYHLLRIVNLLGATIGEQRVRLIMDRISPDNVFEPGALENEDDMKQYTAEYERIQAKVAEKSTGPAEVNVPTTPISPVTALQSFTGDAVQATMS